VAKVFESVAFGSPWRERQHRIETVKGLDGGLFIHTENSRMGGRFRLESDDFGRRLLELQARLGPHHGHTHMVRAILIKNFRKRACTIGRDLAENGHCVIERPSPMQRTPRWRNCG
jgi:hypothetical protein